MRSTPFLALCTLSLLTLASACAAPADDVDDDASELKKRTTPKAGMGAVILEKPAWYDPATFPGSVVVAGSGVESRLVPGQQLDLAPGTYTSYFRPEGMTNGPSTPQGITYSPRGHERKAPGPLAAGDTWKITPSGLRFVLDRPLVFPTMASLGRLDVPDPASFAYVTQNGGVAPYKQINVLSVNTLGLAPGARSVQVLLPAGQYTTTLGGTAKAVTLTEGKLETVAVKTLDTDVVLDPIDPAFPDGNAMACIRISSSWSAPEPVRTMRALKGSVIPDFVPVTLDAYGVDVAPTITGQIRRFTLNRLELDDVEVSSASGSKVKIKGTAVVERKTPSGWAPLTCLAGARVPPLPTHTGLDLPDGTYRITSTAIGPNGQVTSTEEISFP